MKAKATPIPNLPVNPFVFEVLEAASNKEQSKKIEVLQKYAHNHNGVLIWNFDESVYLFYQKEMFLMVILEKIIV